MVKKKRKTPFFINFNFEFVGLSLKYVFSGQVEKYFKDGSSEIISPDGTLLTVSVSGEKKWCLKNGIVITTNEKTREKRSVYPNGQVEIHTPEFKVSVTMVEPQFVSPISSARGSSIQSKLNLCCSDENTPMEL